MGWGSLPGLRACTTCGMPWFGVWNTCELTLDSRPHPRRSIQLTALTLGQVTGDLDSTSPKILGAVRKVRSAWAVGPAGFVLLVARRRLALHKL